LIRIDAVWMSTEPLDMRAGADTALARVVQVFGAAHPHHAYLFANARANRMKVLVHDGVGVWLAALRLNTGKFVWGGCPAVAPPADERHPAERFGAGLALAAHGRCGRDHGAVSVGDALAAIQLGHLPMG
jgi:hypothetical protein